MDKEVATKCCVDKETAISLSTTKHCRNRTRPKEPPQLDRFYRYIGHVTFYRSVINHGTDLIKKLNLVGKNLNQSFKINLIDKFQFNFY